LHKIALNLVLTGKIKEDENTSADERDLASIIYNLDHRPTKGDKKRLQEMMD
jgi:hypothetical protein